MNQTDSTREVSRILKSERIREGGGFIVRRPFPAPGVDAIDPFLLLDEMGPVDYGPGEAVGAPDHPHRGFETITYMLAGEFVHEDSAGNAGTIGPGDVQWMTAGDGVIHSEMPAPAIRERGGRVHGFQIWVNLPARDKRIAPRYQDVRAAAMPTWRAADGKAQVKVVAGAALGVQGAAQTRIPITFLDLSLEPGGAVTVELPREQDAFVYVFGGALSCGEQQRRVRDGELALLTAADQLRLADAAPATRALVLGGRPLAEPIARYGPFVMNTRDEIIEAFNDYQGGRFGQIRRA